jgi:hypothetical protein
VFAGRVGARGHADDSQHPPQCHHTEPAHRADAQRSPQLVSAHQGSGRVGSRLVHVSGEHRSHEIPQRLPPSRRCVARCCFFCHLTLTVARISVPPVIIESMTSNDMVVREGTNVTLSCKAKGFPEPYVMWRREDGDEMSISGENGERERNFPINFHFP